MSSNRYAATQTHTQLHVIVFIIAWQQSNKNGYIGQGLSVFWVALKPEQNLYTHTRAHTLF